MSYPHSRFRWQDKAVEACATVRKHARTDSVFLYQQAPNHIHRLLNQILFDKIYITPDDHTGRLTTTARTQPPFDTILKNQAGPTDNNAPAPAPATHDETPTATVTKTTPP